MSDQTQTSEAPAAEEATGADETPNANLSIEDLASSFVEKVEAQAEESETEAPEATEAEGAEAEEDQEGDVLSQSIEEEDSEEEPEEESEEEDQPKGLKRALSQINRLTARAKGAEEEVASLKEQIQGLKSQPSEPAQDGAKTALEQVQTIQELNDLRKEAMAAKKWALQHIGNDYVEVDGKEYSDADIRNILMEAEEYLGEKIPERATFLQEKQGWQQDTAATFPWVTQGEGPEYELFLQVRDGPQYKTILDTLPNGDFVAGVLVEGIQAIKARQSKPKSKPKKVQTPPPIDAGDAVAPPAQNKEQRLTKKKQAILNKKGNLTEQDFAQYLNL